MTIDRKKPTTTRKKAAAKPAATKTAAKPAAASPPISPTPMLRKKELIERVVVRSGIKKKDAKPVIEAMLAVLGEALANGEDLNLQPLGKVMVKRVKEQTNAKVMVTRIRQRNAAGDSKVVKIST
jgi:DNA-binding protein HU-alpha